MENKIALKWIDNWCEKRIQNPEYSSSVDFYNTVAANAKMLLKDDKNSIEQLKQIKKDGLSKYDVKKGAILGACSQNAFSGACEIAIKALRYQESFWVKAKGCFKTFASR